MTIIGVILSFRELLQEALNAQLEERIPFLYSTILDFHEHASLPEQSALVIPFLLFINIFRLLLILFINFQSNVY